ncbi:hypothetical protein EMPG_16773 [Blastomyces silverae]|uniref:Uncharacterized protein n=1 Tax=Blastomyces silverae TaxID=2060906 RepID=A0A0H1B9P9_9EURO|nr:hypothetical protein EMPG_16773 [Blastomyces silverae]
MTDMPSTQKVRDAICPKIGFQTGASSGGIIRETSKRPPSTTWMLLTTSSSRWQAARATFMETRHPDDIYTKRSSRQAISTAMIHKMIHKQNRAWDVTWQHASMNTRTISLTGSTKHAGLLPLENVTARWCAPRTSLSSPILSKTLPQANSPAQRGHQKPLTLRPMAIVEEKALPPWC